MTIRWLFALAPFAVLALGSASAETLLERGDYLVNAVMGCDGCNTTRPPSGGGPGRFAGGPQTWDTPWYTVRGTNITPDKETGIGSWSDDEIKRLLRDGVRPSGVPVSVQMPFAFYKIMTPRDLDAVVAYIKTVPPVRREVPPPTYKAELPVELVPGGEKPVAEADLNDKLKRGFYLATIAHCMDCHSKGHDDRVNFATGWGKGGVVMHSGATAVNITSHKEKGIGAWTDEQVKRALTHGVRPDGRQLRPPMATRVSKMTDEDIDAIIAWVRTIPPLE
jgi:mono/diheme cytochrome c family protein